jgi:hypothetical protein
MKTEHTREDDGSIKVCISRGHMRVCGWADDWTQIPSKERLLARLLFNNEPLSDTQSV